MSDSIKYSVVIPIYNEEDNIPILYERLVNVLNNLDGEYEIILVDDGSSDSSWELIENISSRDKMVKAIKFTRNFGHQIAITSGINNACGSAIISMDADLQDPPEVIPDLVEKWEEGYDIVYAKRKKRKGENFIKRGFAWLFYRFINRISTVEIPLDVGDFRLIDRKVADVLKDLNEHYRFIRGLTSWIGYRHTSVEFVREARLKGKPKYSFWKLLKLALNGIFSFSIAPIQFASYMGFIVSIFAFLYAIWAIVAKFALDRAIPGWTSIIVVVLFLGGVQLITLGIIGEYLARTYGEVKRRPLYIIDKKLGYGKEEDERK